jgi:hypothetical protein
LDKRKKYRILLNSGREILADNFVERGRYFIAIVYLENELRDLIMIKREDIFLLFVNDVTEEEFREITEISEEEDEDQDFDDCEEEEIITHEVPKQYINLDISEEMYN